MIRVSVAMITYRQEAFVAQALDSVLMQQTKFDYEIIIGEDCSPDGTRAIVQVYAARYPDKIRLQLPETNRGMMRNFMAVLQAARGEYVAFLEGDDYWTSPDKLQRQVEFLDSHPECAICFHQVRVVHEDGSRPDWDYSPPAEKEISTLPDLLNRNMIPNCAVMFRNGLLGAFPPWFDQLKLGDWPLHILNARHGAIGYLPAPMAVYRVHGGGVWSALDDMRRLDAFARMYEYISPELPARYRPLARERQFALDAELAARCAAAGDTRQARRHARRCLALSGNRRILRPTLWRVVLRAYAPGLARRLRELRGRSDLDRAEARP